MKESEIEKKVKQHAKLNGWLVFKFTSPGRRGVPDNIFLKNKTDIFPEFKFFGKKPNKLQEHLFKKIRKQGFHVPIIDSTEQGKKLFT